VPTARNATSPLYGSARLDHAHTVEQATAATMEVERVFRGARTNPMRQSRSKNAKKTAPAKP